MEITGTQTIDAPPLQVWNALNDPDVLKRCLPGCESVERTSPDEFRILIVAAIGPLRARFTGTLRMTEAHVPSSCVMVFEGQGGPAGFGKGSASVRLNEAGTGTELAYSATAQIGGKLAQVGSRLIDSVARKMSDDFFTAFREQFAPAPEAPLAAPVAPERQGTQAGIEAATVAPASATASVPAPAPAPVAAAAVAAPAAAAAPQAAAAAARSGTHVVPGWWLAIAVLLGAASALMGAGLGH
jgi:carbon monoxide dehydrogenase subunit G